jgi:hypothetical protein
MGGWGTEGNLTMSVPFSFFEMDQAFHVGTMDETRRGANYTTSYEGRLLSISNCPNAWRQIAHLDGDRTFALATGGKLLLDLHGLDDTAMSLIASWSESVGLAERTEVFRGWEWDADDGGWRFSEYGTREEAESELRFFLDLADGDPLPTKKLPKGKTSLVEPVDVISLTRHGQDRSGWEAAGDASDIVAAFYAEDVLANLDDRVIGVWWNERYAPQSLSAPRGGLFASALPKIEVTPVRSQVKDGGKLRSRMTLEFSAPACTPRF